MNYLQEEGPFSIQGVTMKKIFPAVFFIIFASNPLWSSGDFPGDFSARLKPGSVRITTFPDLNFDQLQLLSQNGSVELPVGLDQTQTLHLVSEHLGFDFLEGDSAIQVSTYRGPALFSSTPETQYKLIAFKFLCLRNLPNLNHYTLFVVDNLESYIPDSESEDWSVKLILEGVKRGFHTGVMESLQADYKDNQSHAVHSFLVPSVGFKSDDSDESW